MSPSEKALELLDSGLPVNEIETQINALYEQASDEEKKEFEWIYEGLTKLQLLA
jgi:hypothetical protein